MEDFIKKRLARGGYSSSVLCGPHGVAAKKLRELQESKRIAERAKPIIDPSKIKCTFDVYDLQKEWQRPLHLKPYVDVLDRSLSERVRYVFSAPPQHTKTSTTLMCLIMHCITNPGRNHFYITYSQTRAMEVRNDFRNLLKRMGIKHQSAAGVIRVQGPNSDKWSVIRFESKEGSVTGFTCDGVAIVDDPLKGMEEARSPAERSKVQRFFSQELLTREFKDMSVIVMMTRWTHDDLSGVLIKEGWKNMNIKAVCEDSDSDPLHRQVGDALWPEIHPIERLNETRDRDPRAFYAMYQGDPTPEGVRLFFDVSTCQHPIKDGIVTYGIDCAYAGHSKSDWSVVWRLITDPRTRLTSIDKVVRKQCDLSTFAAIVVSLQKEKMGPVFWHTGGNEHLVAKELLEARGVRRLTCIIARGTKRARAQDVADAWNAGKIKAPEVQGPDMQACINEVCMFTGDERMKDDCTDALGSAYYPIVKRWGRHHTFGASGNPFKDRADNERTTVFMPTTSRTGFNDSSDYEKFLDQKLMGSRRTAYGSS